MAIKRINEVTIIGQVTEVTQSFGKPGKSDPNKIFGYGRVSTQPFEGLQVDLNFIQGETTKAGTKNKIYASLSKNIPKLKSIAEDGAEDASWVKADGASLSYSPFMGNDDAIVEQVAISASFINQITHSFDEETGLVVLKNGEIPCATFKLDVRISGVNEETNPEEEETGRLIVLGHCFDFRGTAIPVRLIAGHLGENPSKEDKAKAQKAVKFISSQVEAGDTHRFSGVITTSTKTKVVEEETEFGDPIVKTTVSRRVEYLITSGTVAFEEEKAVTPEEFKDGMEAKEEADERARVYASLRDSAETKTAEKEDGMPNF